eukprot:gene8825-biopygen14867
MSRGGCWRPEWSSNRSFESSWIP